MVGGEDSFNHDFCGVDTAIRQSRAECKVIRCVPNIAKTDVLVVSAEGKEHKENIPNALRGRRQYLRGLPHDREKSLYLIRAGCIA